MNIKKNHGFALLDLFFALIVVGIATFSVYALYQSSKNSYNQQKSIQEIKDISTSFHDLYANHLTDSISDSSSFISALVSSQQLPSSYFSNDQLNLINIYGSYTITNPSSSSVTMTIPMGSTDKNTRQGYCTALGAEINCKADEGDSASTITVVLQAGD